MGTMDASSVAGSSWHSTLASWSFGLMFIWVIFLIHDWNKRDDGAYRLSSFKLFGHMWFPTMLLCASYMADNSRDPMLVCFITLVVFRYYKTVINVWFWFQYEAAQPSWEWLAQEQHWLPPVLRKLTSMDCTVIVPTVGPVGNPVFEEMVVSILHNKPARIIFSTNTAEAKTMVKGELASILARRIIGTSTFQQAWGLGATGTGTLETEIVVVNANVSNKREQVVHALQHVETSIAIFADDTAIWHPEYLDATLPAFANPSVGFVGTRKWVKRVRRTWDPAVSFLGNLCKNYVQGFWNTTGALYLQRHNFEARATNAADGGIFCVSGRTSLIRSQIVRDPVFQQAFLNEYVLGFGPVVADDDNFLTRWTINAGWDIKFQYSEMATMTTVLGDPKKFVQQCMRWSRTTFRQNPVALFVDRTIWWKWPITVWTTYFPWLYNAALIWDPLMLYTLTRTELYTQSEHRAWFMAGMVGFIWATKLIKTAPWYWKHPVDFFLYFLIPAEPAFAYYHSLIKIWTAFTFWDLKWSGRKLQ